MNLLNQFHPSIKKLALFVGILVIGVAIPLTNYLLTRTQTLPSEASQFNERTAVVAMGVGQPVANVCQSGVDINSSENFNSSNGIYTVTFTLKNTSNKIKLVKTREDRCRCPEGDGHLYQTPRKKDGSQVQECKDDTTNESNPACSQYKVCVGQYPKDNVLDDDQRVCDSISNIVHELQPGETKQVVLSSSQAPSSKNFSQACGSFQMDLSIYSISNKDGSGTTCTFDWSRPDNGHLFGGFYKTGVVCDGEDSDPVQERHKECRNNACVDVEGSGTNLCTDSTQCADAKEHLVCRGKSCVKVSGEGTNQCSTETGSGVSDDCSVSVCSTNKSCEKIALSEARNDGSQILCTNSSECNVRNICQNNACVTSRTPGNDECSSNTDCVKYYQVCEGVACIRKVGDKNSTCKQDPDCYVNVCRNNSSCVKEPDTTGKSDQCTTSTDCIPPTHMECKDQACTVVNGAGANTCSGNEDCIRRICENEACVIKSDVSKVADQCRSNADCVTPTHKECKNMACSTVNGAGSNKCNIDTDCSRNVCENETCVKVADSTGAADTCRSNSDCETLKTHMSCNDKRCVEVAGAGENTCKTAEDCIQRICQNETCVETASTSKDQDKCSRNADCIAPKPSIKVGTYKTCSNQSCVELAGTPKPGTVFCNADADCKEMAPKPVPDTGLTGGALMATLGAAFIVVLGVLLIL